MKQFEVTFIVDPVLSGDELKSTVNTYSDMLKAEGCKIVALTELGLRQLAYDINKRSTGIYYTIEFQSETGEVISKLELALRRDERIMRFLTVKLDKFGIKYNEDKRAGKIGKMKDRVKADAKEEEKSGGRNANQGRSNAPAAAATPTVVEEKTTAPAAPEVEATTEVPVSDHAETGNAEVSENNSDQNA